MNPKHREAFTKAAISATRKTERSFNPEEITSAICKQVALNIASLRDADAAMIPDFNIHLDPSLNLILKPQLLYRGSYLNCEAPPIILAIFPTKGFGSLWRPLANRALLAAIGREAFIERQWNRLGPSLAKLDACERISLFRKPLWQSAATPTSSAAMARIQGQKAPISQRSLQTFSMAAAKAFRVEEKRYDRAALLAHLCRFASQNVQALSEDGFLSYAAPSVGRERHRIKFVSSQAESFHEGAPVQIRLERGEYLNLSFDPLPDSFHKLPVLVFRRAKIYIFGPEAFFEEQWRSMAKSLARADAALRAARSLPLPAMLLSEVERSALAKAAPLSSTPAAPAKARSL